MAAPISPGDSGIIKQIVEQASNGQVNGLKQLSQTERKAVKCALENLVNNKNPSIELTDKIASKISKPESYHRNPIRSFLKGIARRIFKSYIDTTSLVNFITNNSALINKNLTQVANSEHEKSAQLMPAQTGGAKASQPKSAAPSLGESVKTEADKELVKTNPQEPPKQVASPSPAQTGGVKASQPKSPPPLTGEASKIQLAKEFTKANPHTNGFIALGGETVEESQKAVKAKLDKHDTTYPGTTFKIVQGHCVDQAKALSSALPEGQKLVVVNAANATHPGGHWENPQAKAQEEALARQSNLADALKQAKGSKKEDERYLMEYGAVRTDGIKMYKEGESDKPFEVDVVSVAGFDFRDFSVKKIINDYAKKMGISHDEAKGQLIEAKMSAMLAAALGNPSVLVYLPSSGVFMGTDKQETAKMIADAFARLTTGDGPFVGKFEHIHVGFFNTSAGNDKIVSDALKNAFKDKGGIGG